MAATSQNAMRNDVDSQALFSKTLQLWIASVRIVLFTTEKYSYYRYWYVTLPHPVNLLSLSNVKQTNDKQCIILHLMHVHDIQWQKTTNKCYLIQLCGCNIYKVTMILTVTLLQLTSTRLRKYSSNSSKHTKLHNQHFNKFWIKYWLQI